MNQNFLASLTGGYQAGQQAQMNRLATQSAEQDQRSKVGMQMAQAILSSPDPARAYPQYMAAAKQQGLNVSAFPEEPTGEAMAMLRLFVGQGTEQDYKFFNTDAGIVRADPRTGGAEVALPLERDAKPTVYDTEMQKRRARMDSLRFDAEMLYPNDEQAQRDFIRQGMGGGTNVTVNNTPGGLNIGDPPDGHVWKRDPNNPNNPFLDGRNLPVAIPVQGSDAYRERQQTIANAQETLRTIDQFVSHPGFDGVYGSSEIPLVGGAVPDSVIPNMPGGAVAGAQSLLNQLEGKSFLEAFETLKGGGQITEAEGRKATAAITRALDTNISEQEARQAWAEFRAVVATGMKRAQSALTGAPSSPSQAAPQAAPQAAQQGAPDFSQMSTQELEAWIAEQEGQ